MRTRLRPCHLPSPAEVANIRSQDRLGRANVPRRPSLVWASLALEKQVLVMAPGEGALPPSEGGDESRLPASSPQ